MNSLHCSPSTYLIFKHPTIQKRSQVGCSLARRPLAALVGGHNSKHSQFVVQVGQGGRGCDARARMAARAFDRGDAHRSFTPRSSTDRTRGTVYERCASEDRCTRLNFVERQGNYEKLVYTGHVPKVRITKVKPWYLGN